MRCIDTKYTQSSFWDGRENGNDYLKSTLQHLPLVWVVQLSPFQNANKDDQEEKVRLKGKGRLDNDATK